MVLGAHSLSEPEDTKQTFDILELHNHPDYNSINYDNDIALIKVLNKLSDRFFKSTFIVFVCLQLDRPFNATDAVAAVSFLRGGGTNPGVGAEVETTGWGSLDNLSSRPDKLQEVVIEVLSPVKCKRSDYFGRKFTANMICAHKVCDDSCGSGVQDSCDVSPDSD